LHVNSDYMEAWNVHTCCPSVTYTSNFSTSEYLSPYLFQRLCTMIPFADSSDEI
jgi:hypothetical protein